MLYCSSLTNHVANLWVKCITQLAMSINGMYVVTETAKLLNVALQQLVLLLLVPRKRNIQRDRSLPSLRQGQP